jgi:hypothetical protein
MNSQPFFKESTVFIGDMSGLARRLPSQIWGDSRASDVTSPGMV